MKTHKTHTYLALSPPPGGRFGISSFANKCVISYKSTSWGESADSTISRNTYWEAVLVFFKLLQLYVHVLFIQTV